MIRPPCKDCPNRVLGCHDTCPKFQAYKEQRQRIYEDRLKTVEAKEAQWQVGKRIAKMHEQKLRKTHKKYRKG